MARNDQAVRLLVVLKQLEGARHGLTLEQLAESLAPGSTRHPRTLRGDLAALAPMPAAPHPRGAVQDTDGDAA